MAVLDYGECPEAIVFQLVDPLRIIEGSGPLQERHWLELRGHGVYENSKNPDKTRTLMLVAAKVPSETAFSVLPQ